MSDPEETAPFTHQRYGAKPEDNPFVPPPGPPSVPPPLPPAPPQYGSPQPGYHQSWPAGWAPMYGAPYPGSLSHKGATQALVLGIVSVASLILGLFCCITLPGVLCAPFAWVIGARAKREIERSPGVYGNLSAAVTAMWMGVAMTVIGALAIVGIVALVVWIGYSDPTVV